MAPVSIPVVIMLKYNSTTAVSITQWTFLRNYAFFVFTAFKNKPCTLMIAFTLLMSDASVIIPMESVHIKKKYTCHCSHRNSSCKRVKLFLSLFWGKVSEVRNSIKFSEVVPLDTLISTSFAICLQQNSCNFKSMGLQNHYVLLQALNSQWTSSKNSSFFCHEYWLMVSQSSFGN